MVERGGAIVTRDELTMSCWDGRVVGEDAINRILSRLRTVAQVTLASIEQLTYDEYVSDPARPVPFRARTFNVRTPLKVALGYTAGARRQTSGRGRHGRVEPHEGLEQGGGRADDASHGARACHQPGREGRHRPGGLPG